MKYNYTWGIDGIGRAHIAKESDMIIIFCMINGCGQEGVNILEDQDELLNKHQINRINNATR